MDGFPQILAKRGADFFGLALINSSDSNWTVKSLSHRYPYEGCKILGCPWGGT